MKKILFVFILFFHLNVFPQGFSYPKIQNEGVTVSDFTPKGWSVLKSANGDLNNDKLTDVAFVIQYKDSVNLLEEHAENVESHHPIRCQPRILIIAFYDKLSKKFKKAEQSNTFILCHYNANMDEPFEDISIAKNVLSINFRIWYSMGSWTMSTHLYKFRYQKNEFALIGAEYQSTHRASGATENRSYNFLTKKLEMSVGNIADDQGKIETSKLNMSTLKTLKTFVAPFTWNIDRDFTL